MNRYLFRTTATMKPYNNKRWWIDRGIISPVTIEADNVPEALRLYKQHVGDHHYIAISDRAMRSKEPMYRGTRDGDPVQIGYVITARTDFEDRDNGRWSAQYIELWVEVVQTINPFEEV